MKAKSLLAVLAAAAMLCTAALPAYAEDTPPAAPAAVEEQVSKTLPTAGQQTGDIEQQNQQNEVATLKASENEDDAGEHVVQENMAVVNVGGSWRNISIDATTYFVVNNGNVEDGTAQNYNVKIEFENND